MDALSRSLFGFAWAWPSLKFAQFCNFSVTLTAALVTVWMWPGWAIYGVLKRRLRPSPPALSQREREKRGNG